MSSPQVRTGDRIVDPMITLAGCSTRQRIVVAGSKSMELMLELHRRGYLLAAAAGNCGRPTGQYDVALVEFIKSSTAIVSLNFIAPCRYRLVSPWCPARRTVTSRSGSV